MRDHLHYKLEEAGNALPVKEASRLTMEEHVNSINDTLTLLHSDANGLSNGVNFDAKDFEFGVVPRCLEGCKLKPQSGASQCQSMEGLTSISHG